VIQEVVAVQPVEVPAYNVQVSGEWREARGCKGRKDIREGDGEYKEGRRGAEKGECKGEGGGGTHHMR